MHVCPRCRRANPEVAVFCHFDGAELRPAHGGAAPALPPGQLPHPFVFPTGRSCASIDDLIEACQEEWALARDLLRQGAFRQFLSSVGRTDLALLAREALAQPDLDLALTAFIGGLPGTRPSAPRLELTPRRLLVGTLHPGETRQVRLTIGNQGQGLLHGTVTLVGGTEDGKEWLRLLDGTTNNQCAIKTSKEQQVLLQVDTASLPAGLTCAAKLTVITNGGVVEVPVRVDLASDPFPWPPFEGAGTQRELAERMRAQPKAAVPLIEGGQIASWFLANGWTYPVQGTPARGVAAVQQFFEAMGLSRPPAVQISESEVRIQPVHPEVVRWELNLFTDAKKWVYGEVDSDSLWLKVLTPVVSGPQQAAIAFEVDSSLLEPNRIYSGQLHVVANAGQQLAVHVRVDVRKGRRSLARMLFRALFSGALAFLLLRLLAAPVADVYASEAAAEQAAEAAGVRPADPFAHPEYLASFVKYFLATFILWTWWLGAALGILLLWRKGAGWKDLSCGAVAGAVAGLIGSASFACLFLVIDRLPRMLWEATEGLPVPAGFAGLEGPDFVSWLAVAAGCWMALGAVIGLLFGWVSQLHEVLLAPVEKSLAVFFRVLGLRRVAAFFA
jgi:hypothetical protein